MSTPTSEKDEKKLLISQHGNSPTIVSSGDISPGIYYPRSPGYDRKSFRPGAVRKIRRRAVFKNGECNILHSSLASRRIRFLQDIFTTLVDTQWRWTLIVFAASFLLSWLGFALIWWLIAFTHGDLEPDHLPEQQEESGWKPCILNIFGFTSCFLFSIETQHTIGYGGRATTEECPEAIFIMCMQSIAGQMIQAFFVGIVFAKMTRPKQRTQTLLFSRNAVINQRDGELCLMFRVGDMRKSHIIGASIRAQLIRPKQTKEGELLSQYQTELEVSADGCDSDLFFIWPLTIVHKINEDSPLFHFSASDMLQERFEIVVILEGTVESTGQTTQARSSYIATEILWGHRFEPVVSYNKERQGYEVNYAKFDNTVPVDTPLCSGAELAEFYRMQDQNALPPYMMLENTPQVGVRAAATTPTLLMRQPSRNIRSFTATTPNGAPKMPFFHDNHSYTTLKVPDENPPESITEDATNTNETDQDSIKNASTTGNVSQDTDNESVSSYENLDRDEARRLKKNTSEC